MFKNARIERIAFIKIIDSFYKKNVISFTDDSFDYLDSEVEQLDFYQAENINFDLKLLNPSVFENLKAIITHESIKSIDNQIFEKLKNLAYFQIDAYYFRKLVNKQGIDWIRSVNRTRDVDLSDPNDIKENYEKGVGIELKFFWGTSFEDVFPVEDFCLYKDFPFQKMAVIVAYFSDSALYSWEEFYNLHKPRPTCTFLWLAQYYPNLIDNLFSIEFKICMNLTIKAKEDMKLKCDFNIMMQKCNKYAFISKNAFGIYDVKILSKYFQVFFIISSYFISLFGICTNSIVVFIILTNKNQDLFKDLKQYPYLCAMSVFNIAILSIQIVAWMSECRGIYDVFCPSTRRYVVIQFLRIIFKECLVVALRFMNNFAYLAFAFNRVALIGKDHAKIVKYFSKLSFKKFMLVTTTISLILSVVKGFKYKV